GRTMRNLLAFAAAAVLVFLGLGWYFDWYHIKTVPTGDGHQSFTIDINKAKIGSDVKTFEKSIEKKKQETLDSMSSANGEATGTPVQNAADPSASQPVATPIRVKARTGVNANPVKATE